MLVSFGKTALSDNDLKEIGVLLAKKASIVLKCTQKVWRYASNLSLLKLSLIN